MTKNIKKIYLFIIIFLSIMLYNSVVSAASFSASASKTTLEKGKNATITITAKECGGRFDITSSNSSVVSVNESNKWVENGSSSVTITAKEAGTATITIKATSVASTDAKDITGNKKISITVKDSTTNNNNNNSNNNQTQPTSDPAPTFTSVNETVYAKSKANVRSSYSTTSSIVGSLKVGDSVKRTGIGSNGWSKISYNGQTAYVSSSLITKTKPEEPKDEKEDKKEEDKEQEEIKLQLSSLKVENYDLNPKFSKDIYEYGLNVENNIEKLEIQAISDDKDVIIEVSGNENLNVGENNITITIAKEKSKEKVVYTIKAIKEDKKVENIENVIKINQDGLNEEIDIVNANLKVRTWTIRGIIIFVTILIIIIFILRYCTTKEDDYEEDYEYINIKQKFNELNNSVDKEEQDDIEEKTDNDYNTEYKIKRNKKPRGKHF